MADESAKMTRDEYLAQRVDDQISWMSNKSKTSKKNYISLKVLEILAAALIPLLSGLKAYFPEGAKIALNGNLFGLLVSILGVLIIVLNGLQQLRKYYDDWVRYRGTIELLKRERFIFATGTAPYDGPDAFSKFVENFEALLADESKKWKDSTVKNPEPQQGQGG